MSNILETLFDSMDLPSLESLVAEGETVLEREYELYGLLEDIDAMMAAADSVEHQQQWGTPVGECGNIRVRHTEIGDKSSYVLTAKVKGKEGNKENEIEITEDFFILFRSMIEKGLCKSRYKFPLEGTDLTLEVDVFKDIESKVKSKYVKIDLELPEGVEISEVKLPFKLTEVRVIKPGHKTDEDLDYVRKLFSEQFDVANPDYQSKT